MELAGEMTGIGNWLPLARFIASPLSRLIEHLRSEIKDERVLKAMRKVLREHERNLSFLIRFCGGPRVKEGGIRVKLTISKASTPSLRGSAEAILAFTLSSASFILSLEII